MTYVALLRGINVGGNNKVDMKQLKTTFENLGLTDVKTYINSGNIIFRDERQRPEELVAAIEEAIDDDFGFPVKVLLRDADNISTVASALPSAWVNDVTMKCDVLFLWKDIDTPEILEQLVIKPELEDVHYVAGAILWRVDRGNITRSGLMRFASSELYKKTTIRNCNTVRKLAVIMQQVE